VSFLQNCNSKNLKGISCHRFSAFRKISPSFWGKKKTWGNILDTVLSSGVVLGQFSQIFFTVWTIFSKHVPAKIFFGIITETKTTRYKRTMCFKQILKHFCVVSFEESSPGYPRRWELVWPCLNDTLSAIFRNGEGVCSFVIYWRKGELKPFARHTRCSCTLFLFLNFPLLLSTPESSCKLCEGNKWEPDYTSRHQWTIRDRW
jgi:hypothetical protein